MSEAAQQLFTAIQALPDEDRAWLREQLEIEELCQGDETEFPPGVVAEWERRVRAANDGTEPWIDGDEFLRQLGEEDE